MSKTTFRIPEPVIEDTKAFCGQVEKFIAGETTAVAFRAIRVPMGIYEQRTDDTYMVRVRGAAGLFLPHQVERVAELAEQYGNGTVHVTTRQDLQIHSALVHDLPTIVEKLLESGLSSRGGGGNTVRNVSACPYAGVCKDEVFDVTPYALSLTEYLVTERANFNLPRKFKVAFSGCSTDCGLGSVADVGFFAHVRSGVKGFAVYAGGGMGMSSSLATLIEDFVPAESIFEVAEAVKRLFDKHGDRTNRNKARLRFVLERVGPDEFRRLYKQELEEVRRACISLPETRERYRDDLVAVEASATEPADAGYQTWKSKYVVPQKQNGLFSVKIVLPLGDIQASDLADLAELARTLSDGTLRTTQDQDILLTGVPAQNLPECYESLRTIDLRFVEGQPVKTVACAGASTCKLGLCLSRGLAEAIVDELRDVDVPFDEPIRISGCPNACGHHPRAAIGLYGGARRVSGSLVPFYGIVAGGRMAEGDASLSRLVTRVPARVVPSLLKEFWAAAAQVRRDGETFDELIERWGADYLRELGEKHAVVPSCGEDSSYYYDFGAKERFSLAGRGPGECGAGVMDVIALDIDTAKRAIEENTLYDAVVSTVRALLITRGLEPKTDREVFAAFSEHLIAPGWVDRGSQRILDAALDLKLGDRASLDDLRDDIRALLARVEQLYQSLDANLNFRVAPVEEPAAQPEQADVPAELDLRGVACPMNFVRAKIQLEELQAGDALDILLDDGEPVRNVPASFADQGEKVLSVEREGDCFRVRVQKVADQE